MAWALSWAKWATNWELQFARHSSRKPILRQDLEVVAGVRFELTTFGLSIAHGPLILRDLAGISANLTSFPNLSHEK